jgi:hypothetical protein
MTHPLTPEAQVLLRRRIDTLCGALKAKAPAGYTYGLDRFKHGQRFLRIVMTVSQAGGRSVHAFVDSTNGDLLKAAGWKAPAKGARGNLLDDADFQRILDGCDWAGGYLYIR